jgi:deoxycytidylate deaminase
MESKKKQLDLINTHTINPPRSTSEQLKERESQELVIGLSGPVGSGVNLVTDMTKQLLEEIGYEVVLVKISNLIVKASSDLLNEPIDTTLKGRARYDSLQTGGDKLRSELQTEILSELAIKEIITHRKSQQSKITGGNSPSIKEFIPHKTAYLIDQLKHPDEVALLRIVYGNLFYLVGVLASQEQRLLTLKDEGLNQSDAAHVMERDRKENIKHGQQLEKTLHLSDYFIRNSHANRSVLKNRVNRLLKLIHGENGVTPTLDEYGMYVAYAAGLKSACLSRQVGAAIADTNGNIVSSGCNDVPKARGGLYTYSDSQMDNRCVHKGYCFNDRHKDKLKEQIQELLREELNLKSEEAERIAAKIKSSSRLSDLIEFSRAVHAEMDAITTVARLGNASIVGGTLYSTTFPCHNCARHIIASGISKVIYIEPYEKSLALDLHGDDITLDSVESIDTNNKVSFLHFEGVSPRQYQNFFLPKSDRKENGKAISTALHSSGKVSPEYLDSYVDFELKVLQNIERLTATRTSGNETP